MNNSLNSIPNYLQLLRDKIDSCEGLPQIAGDTDSDEPSEIDTEFGRVSYSQYELLYARSIGLTTWLIIADSGCTHGLPIAQLDLPGDSNHPTPLSYQDEQHQFQQNYLARLKTENPLCQTAELPNCRTAELPTILSNCRISSYP